MLCLMTLMPVWMDKQSHLSCKEDYAGALPVTGSIFCRVSISIVMHPSRKRNNRVQLSDVAPVSLAQ